MGLRFRQATPRLIISLLLIALGVVVINLPAIFRSEEDRPNFSPLDPYAPMADTGTVSADSLPTDSARVMAALAEVQDPEVPVSIVELGLVESLAIDSAGNIELTLILTVPECPFPRLIAARALDAVTAVPGVRRAEVRIDPTIIWTPDRLGPEARRRYRGLFPDEPGTRR